MQTYILAVCGAVVISVLAAILLPDGKLGKFINGILRLFCLLVMLVPLFGLFENVIKNPSESGSETSGGVALDENFIGYMYARRASEQEADLEKELGNEFSIVVSAQILWNYAEYVYNVTDVTIKIENFGMNGEDEHIFIIEQVRNRAEELIPNAEVTVYE